MNKLKNNKTHRPKLLKPKLYKLLSKMKNIKSIHTMLKSRNYK